MTARTTPSTGRDVLIVMRHGERTDDAPDAPDDPNPSVTATGLAVALDHVRNNLGPSVEALAARCHDVRAASGIGRDTHALVDVVSSPFQRCLDTAQVVREQLAARWVGPPRGGVVWHLGPQQFAVDNHLSEIFNAQKIKAAPEGGPLLPTARSTGELPRWSESQDDAYDRFSRTFSAHCDAVAAARDGNPDCSNTLDAEEELIAPHVRVRILVAHGDTIGAVVGSMCPGRTVFSCEYLSYVVFVRNYSGEMGGSLRFVPFRCHGVQWLDTASDAEGTEEDSEDKGAGTVSSPSTHSAACSVAADLTEAIDAAVTQPTPNEDVASLDVVEHVTEQITERSTEHASDPSGSATDRILEPGAAEDSDAPAPSCVAAEVQLPVAVEPVVCPACSPLPERPESDRASSELEFDLVSPEAPQRRQRHLSVATQESLNFAPVSSSSTPRVESKSGSVVRDRSSSRGSRRSHATTPRSSVFDRLSVPQHGQPRRQPPTTQYRSPARFNPAVWDSLYNSAVQGRQRQQERIAAAEAERRAQERPRPPPSIGTLCRDPNAESDERRRSIASALRAAPSCDEAAALRPDLTRRLSAGAVSQVSERLYRTASGARERHAAERERREIAGCTFTPKLCAESLHRVGRLRSPNPGERLHSTARQASERRSEKQRAVLDEKVKLLVRSRLASDHHFAARCKDAPDHLALYTARVRENLARSVSPAHKPSTYSVDGLTRGRRHFL